MTQSRRHLELLAPARNADYGVAAINHGADAVYIGGPAFGARAKAENSVEDIARLVEHAHRYHAEVFVAFNTIFHDNELEAARQTAWQLYDAGVDALIVQDMGLLQMDIPPIQLHASTQTDIRTVEKAVFLDQVGFTQIVLAREMDLNTIRKVANATKCNLEFFIHGALCVAFSGQCYISHAHTGRSANRGECSQECRLPYTLEDSQGRILAKDKHLLSMKDNDQSANLRALAEAGVSAFKIEGRYKDIAYVKNATAYYRQLLDEIIEDNPLNERAFLRRKFAELFIRPGTRDLHQTQPANKPRGHRASADRKIKHGPLRGSTVERVVGDGHEAHGVFLGSHAQRLDRICAKSKKPREVIARLGNREKRNGSELERQAVPTHAQAADAVVEAVVGERVGHHFAGLHEHGAICIR